LQQFHELAKQTLKLEAIQDCKDRRSLAATTMARQMGYN
jgi:hypothetical protein